MEVRKQSKHGTGELTMAKAYMCDQCKALITEDSIRISLAGYEVVGAREKRKGYLIRQPQDFCSFTCLAEWASEEQKSLDD